MTIKAISELTDEELALAHKYATVEKIRKRAELAAHNQRLDMINFVKSVVGNQIDTSLLETPASVEDATSAA